MANTGDAPGGVADRSVNANASPGRRPSVVTMTHPRISRARSHAHRDRPRPLEERRMSPTVLIQNLGDPVAQAFARERANELPLLSGTNLAIRCVGAD